MNKINKLFLLSTSALAFMSAGTSEAMASNKKNMFKILENREKDRVELSKKQVKEGVTEKPIIFDYKDGKSQYGDLKTVERNQKVGKLNFEKLGGVLLYTISNKAINQTRISNPNDKVYGGASKNKFRYEGVDKYTKKEGEWIGGTEQKNQLSNIKPNKIVKKKVSLSPKKGLIDQIANKEPFIEITDKNLLEKFQNHENFKDYKLREANEEHEEGGFYKSYKYKPQEIVSKVETVEDLDKTLDRYDILSSRVNDVTFKLTLKGEELFKEFKQDSSFKDYTLLPESEENGVKIYSAFKKGEATIDETFSLDDKVENKNDLVSALKNNHLLSEKVEDASFSLALKGKDLYKVFKEHKLSVYYSEPIISYDEEDGTKIYNVKIDAAGNQLQNVESDYNQLMLSLSVEPELSAESEFNRDLSLVKKNAPVENKIEENEVLNILDNIISELEIEPISIQGIEQEQQINEKNHDDIGDIIVELEDLAKFTVPIRNPIGVNEQLLKTKDFNKNEEILEKIDSSISNSESEGREILKKASREEREILRQERQKEREEKLNLILENEKLIDEVYPEAKGLNSTREELSGKVEFKSETSLEVSKIKIKTEAIEERLEDISDNKKELEKIYIVENDSDSLNIKKKLDEELRKEEEETREELRQNRIKLKEKTLEERKEISETTRLHEKMLDIREKFTDKDLGIKEEKMSAGYSQEVLGNIKDLEEIIKEKIVQAEKEEGCLTKESYEKSDIKEALEIIKPYLPEVDLEEKELTLEDMNEVCDILGMTLEEKKETLSYYEGTSTDGERSTEETAPNSVAEKKMALVLAELRSKFSATDTSSSSSYSYSSDELGSTSSRERIYYYDDASTERDVELAIKRSLEVDQAFNDDAISALSNAQKADLYNSAFGDEAAVLRQNYFVQAAQTPEVNSIVENIVDAAIGSRLVAIGIASGDEEEQKIEKGVWVKGIYGSHNQDTLKNISGYKGKSFGAVIGGDIEFNDDLLVGASIASIKSNFKFDGKKEGDKASANSLAVSLYGSKNLTNDFYIQGAVAVVHSDIKVESLKKFSNNIKKKTQAKFASIGAAIEMTVNYVKKFESGINLIPVVGFKFGKNSDSGFDEHGAGLYNVMVSSKKSQFLLAKAGASITLPTIHVGSFNITPGFSAIGSRQLQAKSDKVKTKLNWEGKEYVQEVDLKSHQKNALTLGSSVTVSRNNIDLSANYDFTLKKRFKSHAGSLKLRVNF